jgi:hypothetical protein
VLSKAVLLLNKMVLLLSKTVLSKTVLNEVVLESDISGVATASGCRVGGGNPDGKRAPAFGLSTSARRLSTGIGMPEHRPFRAEHCRG